MMPLPAVTAQAPGPEGSAAFTLHLAPEHPVWAGHFPGDPLVPGVVLVDWAVRLGQRAFGPLGRFQAVDQVKFLRPLRPGAVVELTLHLERGPGGTRLGFQYQDASGRAAAGSVRFLPAP